MPNQHPILLIFNKKVKSDGWQKARKRLPL